MLAAFGPRRSSGLQCTIWIDAGKTQRRIERRKQTGENSRGYRRCQHRPIHMNIGAASKRRDEECAHQIQQQRRKQDAASGAQHSKEHAFGKHLDEQPGSSCADCNAHRHLPPALDAASQQQSRNIHAANGQYRQHRAQQRIQRPLAFTVHILSEQLHVNSTARIGFVGLA